MNMIATPWTLLVVEAMRAFLLLAGCGVAFLCCFSLWTRRRPRSRPLA